MWRKETNVMVSGQNESKYWHSSASQIEEAAKKELF